MKYEFQAIKQTSVFSLNGVVIDAIQYALCYHAQVEGLNRDTTSEVIQTWKGNNLSALRKEVKKFEALNPFIEVWMTQG